MPRAKECLRKVTGDTLLPVCGDEDWRMAVYIMFGDLLQRIEELNSLYAESPERIASAEKARRKWSIFGRTVKSVVFHNDLEETSEVPVDLLEVIANDLPFHGSIRDAGREVEFVREGRVLAKLPKRLASWTEGKGRRAGTKTKGNTRRSYEAEQDSNQRTPCCCSSSWCSEKGRKRRSSGIRSEDYEPRGFPSPEVPLGIEKTQHKNDLRRGLTPFPF